jgi:predicted polyphosphate/ATP-dependent NAD kinase
MAARKLVGLIVNPIAGMGGRVGLKGTDRPETLARARELGATPLSPQRTKTALGIIASRVGGDLTVLAAPGPMGSDIAREMSLAVEATGTLTGEETAPADTIRAALEMAERGVDLLLFAGGDGTARDVCGAIGARLPALGIPTGVKMHSAVYATQARTAGEIASQFLLSADPICREAEVMDIDEDEFRNGRVSARLYGVLIVPVAPRLMQQLKLGSSDGGDAALAGIADDIVERMRDGALYVVGPGTTTRAIGERLGSAKTLLGVDLYCRGELIAADVTERQILDHIEDAPARIVVTPIGGQGFLFGRGNQQLSAEVIRRIGKSNIVVVATHDKIAGLKGEPFLVDTGDPALDAELSGYVRVVTGYHVETVHRIA